MNNVTILSAKENLIETLVSALVHERLDYSRNLVVFPGKRPAHVLRKALAEKIQSSFIPPRIETIDRFIEYLYFEILKQSGRKAELPDVLALLYDVHSNEENKLGHNHYLTLDAFIPVGIKLFSEIEEVTMGLVPSARLKEISGLVPFPQFHSISAYYEHFYSLVKQQGLVTRSMMYRIVAERIDAVHLEDFSRVLFAGFYAFTKVEQEIFRALRNHEHIQYIFQHGTGLARQLEKISVAYEPETLVENFMPVFHLIAAPDLHGQAFALAETLRTRLGEGNTPGTRDAIVLPSSDALFPVYHNVLSLLPENEYNIALGYPVTRTPAFGFLESVMRLAETALENTFSSKEYIKFILHPYVKNIRLGNRSDITRIIMHTIEEYLAEKGVVQISLETIEQNDELITAIIKKTERIEEKLSVDSLKAHIAEIHANTIKRFLHFDSVLHCVDAARELFLYIFSHSTAHLHPYFRPYIEQLLESLETITYSLLAGKKFTEQSGYFSFLRHILAGETVPFLGTPLKGMQTLGLLETRSLSFDTLYILDVNDDVLPGNPEPDLLLTLPIRSILGLETYRDREHLIEYYFNLAVSNAKEVFFYYISSSTGKKEKSRFLEKLLWQQQQRDGVITLDEHEQMVKYNVQLANPLPKSILKTTEMLKRIKQSLELSASSLDTYNDCQVKFYYRHILRLELRDEISDASDNFLIGKIAHKILFEYFNPYLGKRLGKDMITRDRLNHIVDTVFASQFGNYLTGDIVLFKKETQEHLWQYLERYQIPAIEKEQTTLIALERLIKIEKWGVPLKGIIDRIELRGNKTYILDYKTSRNDNRLRFRLDKLQIDDSSTWKKAIPSFQLSLYMLLYEEMNNKGFDNVIPGYLFLGNLTIDESVLQVMGYPETSHVEIYKNVEVIIQLILSEIFNPEKPFTPTRDPETHCSVCPFNVMCGTQWTAQKRFIN